MSAIKPLAWSFSSVNDFLNCPKSYYLKRVSKETPVVETEAMRFGTMQHKHLEDRVRKNTPLPPDLSWLDPMLTKFANIPDGEIFAEHQVALTKGLKYCGWFDKTVWVRGILDVGYRTETESCVLDYKSGKRKFDKDQLMLFAGLEFATRPLLEKVKTGYVWLKDKKLDTEVYTRADVPMIWGHFIPTVEKIEKAMMTGEWKSVPSGLCGWCSAKPSQCKFSKN